MTRTPHTTRHTARHALVPALATLAIPVTSLVLAGRLPSPIARHWGANGIADGASPLWVTTLLLTVLAGALAASALAAVRSAPDTGMARGLVATAHAIAVGMATLHATTLAVQVGLDDWRAATLPFGSVLLALLVPAALGALAGWVLAGDIEVEDHTTTLPADDVAVAPGEAVVWTGRAGSVWAPIGGAVLVLLAGLLHLGTATASFVLPIVLAVAVLIVAAGRAVVTVGPGGLRVRGGVLPFWPRADVPLDEITAVRVEDVEMMSYGGIGYRIRPGARAIVVWPGEAIRVERDDKPALVVTVPGARTGAGVLLAHLRTRSAAD